MNVLISSLGNDLRVDMVVATNLYMAHINFEPTHFESVYRSKPTF